LPVGFPKDHTVNRYSPEITEALSIVCRAPATKIATLDPTLDIAKVGMCIKRLLDFLADGIEIIGRQEYLIAFDFGRKVGRSDPVSAARIVEYLGQGFNVIVLDSDFDVVRLDNVDPVCGSAVSEYSEAKDCTAFHVLNGLDVVIYSKGRTIKEMNARLPSSSEITHKRLARNGLDYKLSLIEFYQNRVRYSQQSDHWRPPGDRSKRILCREIAGRKTEMIFHANLRNWLDENLEGAMVLGGVKKVSDDETDIEIRVYRGPYFILEIKWVGTNGVTPYSESRIRDGIKQVENYLARDPEVREICLVVYDGRPLEKWQQLECCNQEDGQWKEIKRCMQVEFPLRAYGLVFFLENEDASKRK
jgi:hypothetical protein